MKANHGWVAFALVFATACGGGGGGDQTTGPPAGNTPPPVGGISVTNNAFSPSARTVTVGASVQWAWNTCTGGDGYGGNQVCGSHNVTFDDGIASPTQEQGTFYRTFNVAGTFNYHCTVHPMSGIVTVQ